MISGRNAYLNQDRCFFNIVERTATWSCSWGIIDSLIEFVNTALTIKFFGGS